MSDAPPVAAGTLFGLRCTDPDPIGHRAGEIYAQGRDWKPVARLAADSRCYEAVCSHDGGKTWWPTTDPGFGDCPGCGERCPVVNGGILCMTRTHNGLPCLGNGLPPAGQP